MGTVNISDKIWLCDICIVGYMVYMALVVELEARPFSIFD